MIKPLVNKFFLPAKLLMLLVLLGSCFTINANESINQLLDGFHQAASQADEKTYLGSLTEDSVFLGTDASERWTKQQFSSFVKPYFNKGQGWTYYPMKRHISILSDGKTAFFDELLENEKYGQCRGSGVLVKTSKGWKIAQYNLSIPMPNALANQFVKQIKKLNP